MLATGRAATRLKTPSRHFSLSIPTLRHLPHERNPLTNEQLAAFGGKKALQRRLEELGLSPIGFRAILRYRMQEHCGMSNHFLHNTNQILEKNGQITGLYSFPPKPTTLADIQKDFDE